MSPLFFVNVVLVVCAGMIAAWYGGDPERMGGAILVVCKLADAAYHLTFGPSGFNTVDPVHVVLDSGELVALLWLALRANRTWPLWAAAAQLICASGHVAALIEPGGMQHAYWAMTQLPHYIQLAALLLGTAMDARRKRAIGPYRSWRAA